jgi:hypothetical protein
LLLIALSLIFWLITALLIWSTADRQPFHDTL